MASRAEVVVCGAGIAGIATAYQLAVRCRIRDIVLNFCLPAATGLSAPPVLSDGRPDTGMRFPPAGLKLSGDTRNGAKALIVLLNRPPVPDELQVDASNQARPALFAGNAIVLPLEPGPPVEIQLRAAKGSDLEAVEAWITR